MVAVLPPSGLLTCTLQKRSSKAGQQFQVSASSPAHLCPEVADSLPNVSAGVRPGKHPDFRSPWSITQGSEEPFSEDSEEASCLAPPAFCSARSSIQGSVEASCEGSEESSCPVAGDITASYDSDWCGPEPLYTREDDGQVIPPFRPRTSEDAVDEYPDAADEFIGPGSSGSVSDPSENHGIEGNLSV